MEVLIRLVTGSKAGGEIIAVAGRVGLFRAALDFLSPATRAVADGVRAGGRLAMRALRGGLGGLKWTRNYASRVLKGDPIDVATGDVVLRQVDVELAGALPLVLERTHVSSYRGGRLFGMSWASTLDQRLEIDGEGVCFASADGMVLAYPVPRVGVPVLPAAGPRWPLSLAAGGGYTITDPQAGRTWHFAGGRGAVRPLTALSDRNGRRIEFVYTDDLLSEVRHSGGYRIAVDIDDGRVAALRLITGEADGRLLVRFRYDAAGDLTEVINSSGDPLRFTYDDAARLTGWADRNGFWYRYTYDEQGRGVRGEGTGGMLDVRFEYAADGSSTTMTDSLGHATTFHFNELGQIVAEAGPYGRRTVSEWDRHDRLLARTDPLGRTTHYAYDSEGNLTSIVRPDGRRITARYNALNLPVEIVEADGAIWRLEYDTRGNPIVVADPSDAVTRYTYDERGHLSVITDPLGFTTRVVTDRAGLPLVVTDPMGVTTRYERNAVGRVTAIMDPVAGVTRFGWTVEGKLESRTLPGGATERWHYDGEGNCVEHLDAVGNVTRTEFGAFDMPVAEVGPDGARLEFRYDTELRPTAITNPQGLTWRYEYNGAGDLIREIDFNGRALAYTYDAAGQLTEHVNGAGQSIRYEYDPLGNIVEQRSGDALATFSYDGAGRLIRAVNHDADVRFDRDSLGRVTGEICNGRTVRSGYDLAGQRVWRRTPSGADAVWRYDGGGRPATLQTAGQTIRFGRDAAGREIERHIGAAAVLAQRWNSDDRLSSQTLWGRSATGAAQRLQHRSYAYRADGAVTGIADQIAEPRRFDLDRTGRVTDVHAQRWSERYAYDQAGNLAWAASGADHDAAGERDRVGTLVRSAGRVRYTNDAQGRVVQRQQVTLSGKSLIWRYGWDADDRLVAVATPDGRQWRYRYDALGRRVAKQRLAPDGRNVTEQIDFVWDGAVVTEQIQSGHVTTWDYEPGTFRPLAQAEGTLRSDAAQRRIDQRFYAIVTDLIGTPAEFVDAGGNVAGWLRTTLWGMPVSGNQAVACPLRFPGQYHDAETGLHYNFHRYYDPAGGHYQSPDPLGLAPGPNPHGYVTNPTIQIDPLGLAAYKVNVAFGINQNRQLAKWAKTIKAKTLFTLPNEFRPGLFQENVRHILTHPDTKIHFNMTGIDNAHTAASRVAMNGGKIDVPRVSFTDWELYTIRQNPELWGKITWYQDGKIIDNPFK
jgi:RHS repeat-associated protein